MSVVILGAGALAREILESCKRLNRKVSGFFSTTNVDNSLRGFSIFKEVSKVPKNCEWIIGVGNPQTMKILTKAVEETLPPAPPIIDPSVILGENVQIGRGSFIAPGCILTCDIDIGYSTVVDTRCTITHDCKVGDYVHLSPGTILGGNVTIEDNCDLGLGVRVIPGKRISQDSVIGAGGVVINNLQSGLHVGIPTKVKRTW